MALRLRTVLALGAVGALCVGGVALERSLNRPAAPSAIPSAPSTPSTATASGEAMPSDTGSSNITAAQRGLKWYQENTGVPPGTKLAQSGPINVTEDGTVIDGLEVSGDITFTARNITIRNTLVHGHIRNELPGSGEGATYDNGVIDQNVLIEHVEVDAPANSRAINSPWGTTIRFAKVHGAAQGVSFAGHNRIEDSYFYDTRSSGMHSEAILSNGNPNPESGNTAILRNWMDVTDEQARASDGSTWVSGALCMYGDFGQIKNIEVAGNFMGGAGYLLYAGAASGKPFPMPSNVKVTGTTFDPTGWGPVYPSKLDPSSEAAWNSNALIDGTIVPPPTGDQ